MNSTKCDALVLRSLGLPSRAVTCIASAHDVDESITLDKVFLRKTNGDIEPIEVGDYGFFYSFGHVAGHD